jgi:hypothetical protein
MCSLSGNGVDRHPGLDQGFHGRDARRGGRPRDPIRTPTGAEMAEIKVAVIYDNPEIEEA